jgi:hypothetical protein
MNRSLGHEILTLCVGHPTPCLPVSIQTWLNILPPAQESCTGIGLLETLSSNFTEICTSNMGKPNLPKCKTISYKHWKYSPLYWSNCHASAGKLLYPHIISPLFIGALMDTLYTIVLKIGIGWSVIILKKLFGKIVHYIENVI